MDNRNYRHQFVAGNLALDFVNTVAHRTDATKKKDHLQSAEDLYRWASHAGLPDLVAIQSGPLRPAALRRIRAVREELFTVFEAIAGDRAIPEDAVARLGNALHDCAAKRRLSIQGKQIAWSWKPDARCADYLLYPVLTAAVNLLTSEARIPIRQCEDNGCGWLFLDRSNARRRRWCSMADCGNRNKVRNHYQRVKLA